MHSHAAKPSTSNLDSTANKEDLLIDQFPRPSLPTMINARAQVVIKYAASRLILSTPETTHRRETVRVHMARMWMAVFSVGRTRATQTFSFGDKNLTSVKSVTNDFRVQIICPSTSKYIGKDIHRPFRCHLHVT
ncbi:hypothetical protein CHS0354_029667 [Potamilus streckersoni]|uniref:Uncharacterized protein n=1 Tax=Potamilus streckersoni TaxID=2493646 RepID=A0AAE0RTN8_9BIVA|nr:hypothetical protein CHS0354_029667 [Potamilus streckersoni]